MRTLAIETATAACSVALIEDGRVVAAEIATVGRGHAERLLPMIAALPGGGRADHILVDVGPGSFTGIRVGIAAARALAFGWGATVAGYGSLALIAAIDGGDDVTVAIEGGHGELFVARYAGCPIVEVEPPRSIPFDLAVAQSGAAYIVGNAAARLVEAGVTARHRDIAPDARAVVRLASALSALPVVPFYGRRADAKPMVTA